MPRAGKRPNCATDLADCAAHADTAAELNAPDSGRLGWLRVGDLPPVSPGGVQLAGGSGERRWKGQRAFTC